MSTRSSSLSRSPIHATELVCGNGVRITDLTLRPRGGAKGPGLGAFLEAQAFSQGPNVNRAYRQPDGSLLARLSATEVLWLGAQADETVQARWLCPDGQLLAPDTYAVPRQSGSYWFHLTGDAAAGGFSRLCGVDLSAANFPDLEVAQTLVARTSATVIREDFSGAATFHLLGDFSLAAYMWEVLASIIGIQSR